MKKIIKLSTIKQAEKLLANSKIKNLSFIDGYDLMDVSQDEQNFIQDNNINFFYELNEKIICCTTTKEVETFLLNNIY